MKMMDVSMQDDCIEVVNSTKKKKLKQAQLPFQMKTALESPKSISTKKRKLTSPLIECKSPKVVKIAKENINKNTDDIKIHSSVNNSLNESTESIEVVDDYESEKVKGNANSEELETTDIKLTPKQNSASKKKRKKIEKRSTSGLAKFLKKYDNEADALKEDPHNSLPQKVKANDSISKVVDVASPEKMSQSSTDSKDKEENTTALAGNDSLYQNSDSDIVLVSSDDEDKDEKPKISEDVEKQLKIGSQKSPKTPRMEKHDEKLKKLTPKQQEKKLQSAKKREEREKQRLEREKKLEEERENRRKEKEEKRKEKEEKEKAEKEQKLKEKKQREMKKQMEIEQKQKEKEAKEEERRKREEAKEEEKRKKEEEKLEAERKKQKAASNFASFFVAKKQETKSFEEENLDEAKNFMPFEVKADMKIAPVCRRVLNEQEKSLLDAQCNAGNEKKANLYLSAIKNKTVIPRKSTKTWPLETKDDVIVLDEENDGTSNIVDQNVLIEKQWPKLLQFVENRRPPYWGTWRKHSDSINPRKPFSKDTKWFNYEVDSDDEWEEEEPGESLHGSDDEKDEENPDDNEYDVDNEFMVPHGYLSDEEVRADEEEQEDMSPETQKYKLKVLGEQFETERNTKTSKLKPKIIGCIWQEPGNMFSENVPPRTVAFLRSHQAWVRQIPVVLPSTTAENESLDCGTPTQHTASARKSRVPEEALPDLIRLVHGNTHARSFLAREFMAFWSKRREAHIPKSSLIKRIRELATWMSCPEEGPMHLKPCWYVPEETRRDCNLEDLTLPNRWSYSLTPKRKSEAVDEKEKEEKDKETKVPLITQFTKKITHEELKKQLKPTPPNDKKAPKRATLISVGRGEQFSKSSRENLMNKFINSEKKEPNKGEDSDVVMIERKPSTSSKENERLASGSLEKSETKDGSSTAAEKDNEIKILECNSTIEKSRSDKNTKETSDTRMDDDKRSKKE